MATPQFEEKIIYKTRQHWIIPVLQSIKLLFIIILPVSLGIGFFASSVPVAIVGFFILSIAILGYEHYLWHHSWLMIGNQKITLSIRNGIFSQYAMNIRYRNIRDCAVSKNSMLGFFLKYGTLFIRSTSAEGDFMAHHVPKVGKVYALVNALSRYTDDERADIETIEELHNYHTKKEFSGKIEQKDPLSDNLLRIQNMPGVLEALPLDLNVRTEIATHEELRNHGVHEVLRRKYIICLLHDSNFRPPAGPITAKNHAGEVYFPGVAFPEIVGSDRISASPGQAVHALLRKFFPYATETDATVLVGWND